MSENELSEITMYVDESCFCPGCLSRGVYSMMHCVRIDAEVSIPAMFCDVPHCALYRQLFASPQIVAKPLGMTLDQAAELQRQWDLRRAAEAG